MHKNALLHELPGPANLKARRLYNTIARHFEYAVCRKCSFYKRYGVMIVKGDLLEHIQDINDGKLELENLDVLQAAKLIKLEDISERQHRVTICEFAPKEIRA